MNQELGDWHHLRFSLASAILAQSSPIYRGASQQLQEHQLQDKTTAGHRY